MLKRLFYRALLICILALSAGCGGMSAQEGSCSVISASGYLASQDCNLLSWPENRFPIRLTREASVSNELILALDQAIYYWESKTGVDLFEVEPQFSAISSKIDHSYNTIAIRDREEWTLKPVEGKEDEPAKTVYFYNSDGLYNSNIFFNEAFVNGSKGNYDLFTIMLHELGHVLGLDHDNTEGDQISIMHSKIKPGEQRLPTETDIMRVRALYDPS